MTDQDKFRILVVEDSKTQAEILRHLLNKAGYEVQVAYNGREALEEVKIKHPTIVLTDVIMPEMNGYELCRNLKRDPDTKNIPVILVTQLFDPMDVLSGLECGADNFIIKPYESSYLLDRIKVILANTPISSSDECEGDRGVSIFFSGKTHQITSNRQKILNILLSTYEIAISKNNELIEAKDRLASVNDQLSDANDELLSELSPSKKSQNELEDLIPDEDIDFGFTLKRFVWLDQYRGSVILIFSIALITFPLSGDIFTGEPPIGPTYLNHGFMFAPSFYLNNGGSYPYVITMIDLGQGTLMFLIGLMQSYTYKKRLAIAGQQNAISHVLYRTMIFFILSLFMYDIILGWGWYEAVFNGTIAIIAWCSLISPFIAKFIKSTKGKFWLSISIIFLHFILYSIPSIRDWNVGEGRKYFEFPFLTLNMIAISIMGAVYQEWYFDERGEMNREKIRTKVIPYSFFFFIPGYLLEFFQSSYQPRCTSALAFIILGWAGVTSFLSYAIVEAGTIIKPLQILGENLFVIFFIAPLVALVLPEFANDLIRSNKFAAVFLAGILPLAIIYLICWFLHKKKLKIKI